MQTTLRSPVFRAIFVLVIDLSLMVLMTPILSLVLWQNSDITGRFMVMVSLMTIPVNYIYTLVFDHTMLRQGRDLYERSLGLRLLHSLLLESIMLPVVVLTAIRVLGVGGGKALALGLFMAMLAGAYNLFMNRAFDSQEHLKCIPKRQAALREPVQCSVWSVDR
ncbi:chlorhexidine efflux transporter [Maridesulfovibrio salexigens]|uniref:Chlorhexidine efflux transporter domain-containing protein n=1 Tax=Maridesulfovibrio salexigens (strain ATCC 14822 / DSM 2638 / NCIMB 8403 / VKM B-1763) TaxID=526222 RepID=C6BS32_MARSD|nr:chlorhexidine efflux transporter [Maridesulfovibrio salexigens]ACS81415.1 hypothetical protein Desal_3365 [Maridesulfovibrio salexigens DSM 2638]